MPKLYNIPTWFDEAYATRLSVVKTLVNAEFHPTPGTEISYRELELSLEDSAALELLTKGNELCWWGRGRNIGYNVFFTRVPELFLYLLPRFIVDSVDVYDDGESPAEHGALVEVFCQAIQSRTSFLRGLTAKQLEAVRLALQLIESRRDEYETGACGALRAIREIPA